MKTQIKQSTVNFLMTMTLLAAVLMMFGFYYGARVDGWHSALVIAAFFTGCGVTMTLFGVWVYSYNNMCRPTW